MSNSIDNDKYKIFSEIFENLENFVDKKETDIIFISTESWLAQLGKRNLDQIIS